MFSYIFLQLLKLAATDKGAGIRAIEILSEPLQATRIGRFCQKGQFIQILGQLLTRLLAGNDSNQNTCFLFFGG